MMNRKAVMAVAVVALLAVAVTIPAAAVTWRRMGTVSGRLSRSGDQEIYRVRSLSGGQRYKIALTGPWSADFDLAVYDENGNLVAKDTDSSSDGTVYITPRWTGPFYIKVVSYRGSGVFTVRIYKRL